MKLEFLVRKNKIELRLKGLKIIIKMGFKSAKNIRKVNQSNSSYEEGNMIFPSRLIYSTIASIDRNLGFLYSSSINNEFRETIRYSTVRDDDEEFDAILDRVEERINRFKLNNENIEDNEINLINGKVKIVELDDAAFNRTFLGIMDFLYEASDLPSNGENHFEKRIIGLANRLWGLGISPSEF